MKKISLFIIALVLIATVGIFAEEQEGSQANAKSDLKILDVQSWDAFVYNLVPEPTGKGNSADYFMAAIYFQKTPNSDPNANSLGKKYSWWKDFGDETLNSDDPKRKEIVAEAIKIPELDLIVEGAKLKDFRLVGVYISPSPLPTKTVFDLQIISYIDLMKLTKILVARANDKLAKGDKAGAEADMYSAFNAGHLIQKDIFLLGFMVGNAIENRVAKQMPDFYKKMGNAQKEKLWTESLDKFAQHLEAAKNVFKNRSSEELRAIVDDKTLPGALRIEAMTVMAGKYFETRSAILRGFPKEYKDFITREHFDDPAMILLQLKLIEDVNIGVISSLKGRMMLGASIAAVD